MNRIPLATLPTPLQAMPRLGARLGLERLFVKRDDLTGLALGGNKARKLELLCAEAIDRSCDTLVTGGGPQSNHARMTAAAASRLGLACHLVLGGPPPDRSSANLILDRLFGATLHFAGGIGDYYEVEAAIVELAGSLRAAGSRPATIPIGGASTTGAVAYALAADELAGQLSAAGIGHVDAVVVADGSGGTHAGLLAGFEPTTSVIGVDVGTRPDLDTAVPTLAHAAAEAAGRPAPQGRVIVDREHFGAGYGALNDATLDALRLTARTEGIALDPVYSAKAMSALITRARDQQFDRDATVVFWHTGGTVALFADRYATTLSAI